jgi:hypothetical protein
MIHNLQTASGKCEYMTEQQKEFLKQLNREIHKHEQYIESAKKELLNSLGNNHTVTEFGLSRDAETITKYSCILKVLQEQKYNFLAIFEIVE